MSASFYDLLKYAATGIASPDMTYYDRMRASTLMGGSVQTLTGIPPLSFPSDGSPITVWSMKGNGQQTGTPTHDNPVMPEFVGVRTANLFDYVSYFDSTFTNYNQFFDYADLRLSANTTYTLSTSCTEVGTTPRNTSFIVANPNDVPTTASGGISSISPITITTGSDGKLRLYKRISGSSDHPTKSQFNNGEQWLMLNLGSTALPYEPFGWSEKITCAGQTVPVYLGQVSTVRRVQKLVFDGTEEWRLWKGNYFSSVIDRKGAIATILCTHFINSSPQGISYSQSSIAGLKIASVAVPFVSSVNDLKAWLASEYAVGNPVTIWYVLATEQTGIVNEPLAKIGDYADELHSEDAAVTIPTVKGSNTLTVESELQPSEMTITYKG